MTTIRLDSAKMSKDHANKSYTKKKNSYKSDESAGKAEKPRNAKKPLGRHNIAKKKTLEQIKKIEWSEHKCEKCGKPITDLTQALSDKATGKPVHFECILAFLKNSEELKEKEEVVYIGHGNFAVVYFENPKIRSNFKIVKIIEWEDRNKVYEWRDEVAKLGSST